jgi:hypothetical protein
VVTGDILAGTEIELPTTAGTITISGIGGQLWPSGPTILLGSELTSDTDRTYGRGGSREMVVVVVVTANMTKAKGRGDRDSEVCLKYRKKGKESPELALKKPREL